MIACMPRLALEHAPVDTPAHEGLTLKRSVEISGVTYAITPAKPVAGR